MSQSMYDLAQCGRDVLDQIEYMLKQQKERKKRNMRATINGVSMEGTPEQLAAIARALGVEVGNDGVHYLSYTKGLVRIVDMDANHLRNAIAKRVREWAETLRTLEGSAFLRAVAAGPQDVTTRAMVLQLTNLVSRGTSTYRVGSGR